MKLEQILGVLETAKLSPLDLMRFHMGARFEESSYLNTLNEIILAFNEIEYMSNLVISAPARIGTSTLLTKYFPAWNIMRELKSSVMINSYSKDLSNSMVRNSRNVVENLGCLFGVSTPCKSKSMYQAWGVEEFMESEVRGTAFGANLMGHGADIIITDNLYSPNKDEDTLIFELDILRSRLMPNGKTITSINSGTERHENEWILDRIKEWDSGLVEFNWPNN